MNDEYSINPHTRNVNSVLFGVLSPEKIREQAVCKIDKYLSNIKETSIDAGSVVDPRLGTTTKNQICPTCQQGYDLCPGHFGYIELALPIYNLMYMPILQKVLKCTCINCGQILVEDFKQVLQMNPKNRLNWLASKVKMSAACPHCGFFQPKYALVKKEYICITMLQRDPENPKKFLPDDKAVKLSAMTLWSFFRKISDDQCLYYGFNPQYSRPDWMIWTLMPVPPLHVRPILGIAYNNKPSIDDLTVALNTNIIKVNNELTELIQKLRDDKKTDEEILNNNEVDTKWDLLQNCINQYINNESMSVKLQQKNGRPLKSITERIKTKKGIVRNNLEGKRVNESARSVVTCDPDLDIDQVGIPLKIAMGLTFPEVVNRYNIDMLKKMVLNGPNKYPGAKSIKYVNDGKTYALINEEQCKKRSSTLQFGDIVNRHLLDNDLVMLNRQPSLHRMNIMAHRVKVLNYDTFRINPNVTTPYNADFDGDEMNIFCVTNYMQIAELKYLMHVSTQIISPQINSPIIGTVQDSTLAPYLFTTGYTKLNRDQYQQALAAAFTNDFKMINFNRDIPNAGYNVETLLSMMFPEHFAYTSKNLKVLNGNVTNSKPIINKSNLVAGNYNTIFHQAFNTLGAMATNRLFNEFAKFANEYFIQTGFTTSIEDCFPPDSTFLPMIKKYIERYDEYISKLIWLVSDTPINKRVDVLSKMNLPDNIKKSWKDFLIHNNTEINEMYPTFVQSMWNSFAKDVEQAVFNAYEKSPHNGLYQMITSGSKGSKKNLTAIIGLLGQQDVDGHWVLEEMAHRTLPHFAKDTNTPYAHGFIKNNYFTGLDPVEYYFQAIAGRFTQMLKSIKTADTGYFQRCFIKMLENVYSAHDNSIRNSFGSVIEYLYGGDGFNVYNLMKVDISDLKLWRSVAQFTADMQSEDLVDMEYRILLQLYKNVHSFFIRYKKIPSSIMLPLNISQIIANARKSNAELKKYNLEYKDKKTVIWNILTKFYNSMQKVMFIDYQYYYKLNIIIFATMYYLRSSVSIEFIDILSPIISEIERNIRKSLIKPTENIGIITAQSIGQPTTQMSLNAFHNSGRSTTVTGGVPRLKELVRLSNKIATPSMTIYLQNDTTSDKQNGEKTNTHNINVMKSRIAEVTIGKLLKDTNITYCNTPEALNDIGKVLYRNSSTGINNFYYVEMIFDKFNLLYNNMFMYNIDVIIRQYLADDATIAAKTAWTYQGSNGYYGMFIKVNYDSLGESKDNVVTSYTIVNMFGVLTYIDNLLQRINELILGGVKNIKYGEIDLSDNKRFIVQNDTIISADTEPAIYQQLTAEHDYRDYIILTTGTNLLEIMSMLKNIDKYRTITNDVNEIFMLYGIEAARNALIHEINIVMNNDNSDTIDRRHLQLLVDMMCHQGFLISMDRHGMFKSTSGPLQRASFEETAKQLITASVFNEVDTMNSISDNIMFGQCIPTGTGSCSLQLNMGKFMEMSIHADDNVDTSIQNDVWKQFNMAFKNLLNPNL